MSKRPYPLKKEEEKRVVISFTLSADRLLRLREKISLGTDHEPSIEEIRSAARDIAQTAIDEQIKRDN